MKKLDWQLSMKSLTIKLKFVGVWPEDNAYKCNFYTLYAILVTTFFTFGICCCQTIHTILIWDDIDAVTATIFVDISEFLNFIKICITMKKMKLLKQLWKNMNADIFQPKNTRQIRIGQANLRTWKNICFAFQITVFFTVFFMTTFPIFDGTIKEHRLPLPAWYPYNTTISPFYEITYAVQVVGFVFTAATALGIDSLFAGLSMYVGAQLDILCDNVEHLLDTEDDDESDLKQKFVNVIKHHKAILQFAKDSEKFYNWIVLGQFLISAVTLGITLFLLSSVPLFSNHFFAVLIFWISVITEIFLYCWFGNEIEIKSNRIYYTIFKSNWIDAPLALKKDIVFFFMNCRKPLKVSALNLFFLSLDTFINIIKASGSYYTLFSQLASRD